MHEPVTREEVRSSIFRPDGRKAAGPDGINNAVLRQAWAVADVEMHELFSLSLSKGHHPKAFKRATLVALRNDDDDDVVYCLGARAQIVLRGRLEVASAIGPYLAPTGLSLCCLA